MLKKSFLFILFVSMFLTTSMAQNQKLPFSFSDFEKWAKQITIPGYSLMQCENEDNFSYVANLMSSSQALLQVRIENSSRFKSSTSGMQGAVKYIWKGYETVYSANNYSSVFIFNVPDNKIAVLIGVPNKVDKVKMEDFASKIKFQNLKPGGAGESEVAWPAEIPAECRIKSVESIESQGPDDIYKNVIKVKAFMNNSLVQSLEALMKKYKTEDLSIIKMEKLDFCAEIESLPQLKAFFQEGEIVTFTYYVK
jgi:hypothetical protein